MRAADVFQLIVSFTSPFAVFLGFCWYKSRLPAADRPEEPTPIDWAVSSIIVADTREDGGPQW
jgi:hypothetical protein